MATIDLTGVPIPVDDPEFRNDAKLLKKIMQLESLIELKHDMEDAEEGLRPLHNSLEKKTSRNDFE